MLGPPNTDESNNDETRKSTSKSSLSNGNQFVDPKIVEDEIARSEKYDQENGRVKKNASNDLVEDFDNYSDDGFDNADKLALDDAIVDEVGDDDAIKMVEDEIGKASS